MNTKTDSHPLIQSIPWLTWEILIFGSILIVAAFTRFMILGERAMSHDESLHTYYAWRFAEGFGYQHNPMMHGPFQFHILAVIYYLFGASDFTSRIPAALFSLATLWMIWYWRRFLGKWGALFAALLLVFSPYMLFYGRYTRNEAFVGLYGIIMLYAVLRYFETGRHRYLYILVLSIAFHLITKETSYIYIGMLLIYLSGHLVYKVIERRWDNETSYKGFILSLIAGIVLLGAAASLVLITNNQLTSNPSTLVPSVPGISDPALSSQATYTLPLTLILIGLGALGVSLFFLFKGFGITRLREQRSFDMLMLTVTLILPTLSAPLTKLFGISPLDYSAPGIARSMTFIIPLTIISIILGLWWNRKVWGISTLLFWSIFITFYTSFFTHGTGFFSGLIGSLGYWLEQQPVQRGSQPLYYYLLIQIPVYEFLPAFGALLGYYYGFRHKPKMENDEVEISESNFRNTFSLLGFWAIASLIAFTIAGERMPWLTYHITLPMILLGGWGIGQLIDRMDWQGLKQRHPLLSLAVMIVLLASILASLYALLGANPPFAGKGLDQLNSTRSFLVPIAGIVASLVGLWLLLKGWNRSNVIRFGVLTFTGILFFFTISTSLRASFINQSEASEFLVYAHGASGIKNVLRQVEDISYRTTGSPKNIVVAYDDDSSWPLTWYLRDFPNQRYYGAQPGGDLGDVPVIIVGDNNFAAIEPFVRNNYYRQDFIRMVWPNMDYFNLTPARIAYALRDKDLRAGLMSIWLERDYTQYANALTKVNEGFNVNSLTPAEWSPADRMRLYIRKDIAGQIWEYGSSPVLEIPPDPYEGNRIELIADLTIGSQGAGTGQFEAPRELAIAPDGSIYVADSRNHRIQHFSRDGNYIDGWGSFADINQGEAQPGTLNEPWGVAVAKDGSVFVSDTWNHRIQKFSKDGKPIMSWGQFGQIDTINGFYGPRGLAISPDGMLYIADTGNSRIVIYDLDGNYVSEFGSPGVDAGQFSEPVDIHIHSDGYVYVTDTWNQRVQVFAPNTDHTEFIPVSSWNISGWYGGSNENKPYITLGNNGHVFITDPEGYRVIEFDGPDGNFIRTWGIYGTESGQFNLPTGIIADRQGRVWVSDSGNNRILRFTLPEE